MVLLKRGSVIDGIAIRQEPVNQPFFAPVVSGCALESGILDTIFIPVREWFPTLWHIDACRYMPGKLSPSRRYDHNGQMQAFPK